MMMMMMEMMIVMIVILGNDGSDDCDDVAMTFRLNNVRSIFPDLSTFPVRG